MRSETRFEAWHRQSVQRWTWKSKCPRKADAAKKMEANHERLGAPRLATTGLVEVSCYDRLGPVRGLAHDRVVDLFSRAGRHGDSGGSGKKYRRASIRKPERGQNECLLRGWHSGRNSRPISKNFGSQSDLAHFNGALQKHSGQSARDRKGTWRRPHC